MIKLLHGDCLELMKQIPDKSVDLVLTDPPYGIDYQSSWRIDKAKRLEKIKNDKTPFIWFLRDAARVLKDDGCLMIFCRWDVQESFKVAIECAGLTIKNQLVWDRVIHGMGDLKGNFAPQHDVIWFATKGLWKVPNKRPKSILKSQRLSGEQLTHPNEKPIDLMTQCIEAVSINHATVLDCFMGSGTTGVACKNLNRRFIGIELDETYFKIAEERIKAA